MSAQIKYYLLIIKNPRLGFSIVIGAIINYVFYSLYLSLLKDLSYYYFGAFITASFLAGYMFVIFTEKVFEKITSKIKFLINARNEQIKISKSIDNTYHHLTYSQLNIINSLMNETCKYKNDTSDIITLQNNRYIVKCEKINSHENIYKINKLAKPRIDKIRKNQLELNADNIAKNPNPVQKELLDLFFEKFEYIEEMNKTPHRFYDVAIHLHKLGLLEMEPMECKGLIKFSINKYFSRKLSKLVYKERKINDYIIINLNFVPHSGASGGGSRGFK